MPDKEESLITAEAEKYLRKSENELDQILLQEWRSVSGPEKMIPTKGDSKDFLKNVVKRLAKKVVENRATVSSAFGLAVGEAVNWARNQGYDLTAYRIFISVMAAAIANSVIEELESRIS